MQLACLPRRAPNGKSGVCYRWNNYQCLFIIIYCVIFLNYWLLSDVPLCMSEWWHINYIRGRCWWSVPSASCWAVYQYPPQCMTECCILIVSCLEASSINFSHKKHPGRNPLRVSLVKQSLQFAKTLWKQLLVTFAAFEIISSTLNLSNVYEKYRTLSTKLIIAFGSRVTTVSVTVFE